MQAASQPNFVLYDLAFCTTAISYVGGSRSFLACQVFPKPPWRPLLGAFLFACHLQIALSDLLLCKGTGYNRPLTFAILFDQTSLVALLNLEDLGKIFPNWSKMSSLPCSTTGGKLQHPKRHNSDVSCHHIGHTGLEPCISLQKLTSLTLTLQGKPLGLSIEAHEHC